MAEASKASRIRAAAFPVGAARNTTSFAFSSKSVSRMPARHVVFPVPGPPNTTQNGRVSARPRTAARSGDMGFLSQESSALIRTAPCSERKAIFRASVLSTAKSRSRYRRVLSATTRAGAGPEKFVWSGCSAASCALIRETASSGEMSAHSPPCRKVFSSEENARCSVERSGSSSGTPLEVKRNSVIVRAKSDNSSHWGMITSP